MHATTSKLLKNKSLRISFNNIKIPFNTKKFSSLNKSFLFDETKIIKPSLFLSNIRNNCTNNKNYIPLCNFSKGKKIQPFVKDEIVNPLPISIKNDILSITKNNSSNNTTDEQNPIDKNKLIENNSTNENKTLDESKTSNESKTADENKSLFNNIWDVIVLSSVLCIGLIFSNIVLTILKYVAVILVTFFVIIGNFFPILILIALFPLPMSIFLFLLK